MQVGYFPTPKNLQRERETHAEHAWSEFSILSQRHNRDDIYLPVS